jgi:hypothetical protein
MGDDEMNSGKLLVMTKTYVMPYAELLAEVRHGSNNNGSALEDEITERANCWIDEGWTPDYDDARIAEW